MQKLRSPRLSARLGVACVTLVIANVAFAGPRERPKGALAPSSAYAAFVMSKIATAAGLDGAPEIFRAPVVAAHAVFVDGREAVVYNPGFLDTINDRAGTPWAAVSVIAHELGHHFYGHSHEPVESLPPNVLHEHELEADYFSGFVLERMGASLDDAEAAQEAFFMKKGTATHPSSDRRLAAISAGWKDAANDVSPVADPAARLASIPDSKIAPNSNGIRRGAVFPSGPW